MKTRTIIISSALLFFLFAGRAQTGESQTTQETLARKSGCYECHSPGKEIAAPTFADMTAKYKGQSQFRQSLIESISKGSKGNWTAVSHGAPMPPYAGRLSDAEIRSLVDWIIGSIQID